MKRVFVILLAVIGFGLSANAQKDCTTGKYNSVGTAAREKTPYTAIVSSTQEGCGYKISFQAWNFEQGSVYCDVKFTNLNGEEEKWNGTGDFSTIKAKPGTTIYARFWNSTNLQIVSIDYKVCKITL